MPTDHEHKFFLFETKATFEGYQFTFDVKNVSEDVINLVKETPDLYIRVEYAIMACNCGHVKKVKVEQNV